jgi:peptidoglycan/LPS O-acetylase OafA/YrhL
MHLLDLLRFGAAAAVVVYHFTATPTASQYWGADVTVLFDPVNHVTRYGWLAVEVFFVISGFTILFSSQGRTVAQFAGSRVGRLYPALWACVLLTAALQVAWSGGRQLGIGDTIANLTMAPAWFGAELSQVVYWTLLVELKFYLLVALLMAAGPLTRARVVALALAWPALGIAVRALGYPVLAEHLVIRHSVYFGIGMLLFVLWKDAADRRAGRAPDGGRQAVALTLAALTALLVLSAARVTESAGSAATLQGVDVQPWVCLAIFLASVAAVWFAGHPRASTRRRWLAAISVTAGALTYPLYLVHTQFGWAITEQLTGAGVSTWSTLAVATAASLALAAVIYYAVERPFSHRLRRATTAGCARLATKRPVPPPACTAAPSGDLAPAGLAGGGHATAALVARRLT